MRKFGFIGVAVLVALIGIPILEIGAASNPGMKVEYHRYALAATGLVGAEGPCDDDAVGAVVFCETLALEEPPDKFHVALRDDLPVPTGGRWQFQDNAGTVLHEGTFCREENEGPVPENATRFVVRVEPVGPECATVGLQGWAIVTWRWGRDPTPAKPDC